MDVGPVALQVVHIGRAGKLPPEGEVGLRPAQHVEVEVVRLAPLGAVAVSKVVWFQGEAPSSRAMKTRASPSVAEPDKVALQLLPSGDER